jgi:hypothetical protein
LLWAYSKRASRPPLRAYQTVIRVARLAALAEELRQETAAVDRRAAGTVVPAASHSVGRKSTLAIRSSLTRPAGMRPASWR